MFGTISTNLRSRGAQGWRNLKSLRCSSARPGQTRLGSARLGLACPGLALPSSARQGSARLGPQLVLGILQFFSALLRRICCRIHGQESRCLALTKRSFRHPATEEKNRPLGRKTNWLGRLAQGSSRVVTARTRWSRLGSAQVESTRLGLAQFGSPWRGPARLGWARFGSARLGSAPLGSARPGPARSWICSHFFSGIYGDQAIYRTLPYIYIYILKENPIQNFSFVPTGP